MANKYIIHGATFCGDGTSPAEATSNGGVGALNSFVYFEGTAWPAPAVLAAGDTVNLRSKDASGANITRTLTANMNLGSASATTANWISWIIDGGAVWSGVSGTITYTHASTWVTTIRQYNHVESQVQNSLVFSNTSVNQSSGTILVTLNGVLVKPLIDWTAKTGAGACLAVSIGDYGLLESPVINWGVLGGTTSEARGLITGSSSSFTHGRVVSPKITINGATPGFPIFYAGTGARSRIDLVGGYLTGAGATSGQSLFAGSGSGGCEFNAVGFQFPRTMDVCNSAFQGSGTLYGNSRVSIIGCDGGAGGHLEEAWGFATSRTDSNPPVLQATLPDSSNTAWSWRVYPRSTSKTYRMALKSSKLFTGSAAAKTITQEILVANTMSANKGNLWITVEYTDNTTGLVTSIGTFDMSGGALDTSTAEWSAAVWGAITFNKRKISITTPSSVKQDTMITVTLWGTLASSSANDIYFVDPDFSVN